MNEDEVAEILTVLAKERGSRVVELDFTLKTTLFEYFLYLCVDFS